MSAGSVFFRYRLAVIAIAFGLAVGIALFVARVDAAARPPLLRTLSDVVGKNIAFLASGIACLIAFTLRAFGEAKLGSVVYGQSAGPQLVTSGIFGLSRNPLYLGTWLFFVAATAPYLPPLVIVALALAFGLSLRAIALYEERDLTATFGDAFARYAREVPRFIGIPRRSGDGGGAAQDSATSSAPGARLWAAAIVSNLFFFSLGAYRVAMFGNANGALGEANAALGLLNVACFVVWLLVVIVRRMRKR